MAQNSDAEQDALLERCRRNGVSIEAIYDAKSDRIAGEIKRELLQMCLEVEAGQRAERAVRFTLIVAVSAFLSALASWAAVLKA